ncbi:PQQ-binding-like beta-propeller repeat protein [Haloferax sp. KTX1]|uniref:outer membrane protein assembly factor BamB family protein n=1 Tax=Haloferax sp. KTX1 TaxID=2600597 RepID=UPI001652294C|nr:PQQ-binding-like beta-propeller repeat protein [Haloferax sp. KTX1]
MALIAGGSIVGGEALAADGSDAAADSGAWPQLQGDAAHSGSRATDSLGATAMRDAWADTEHDEIAPGASTGVVVADGVVYAGLRLGDGQFSAFTTDGSFVEIGSGTGGNYKLTPAVAAGSLLVPTDEGLVAWDASSYEVQWRTNTPVFTAATVADGTAFVGEDTTDDGDPDSLVAYDVADGTELWRRDVTFRRFEDDRIGSNIRSSTSPAVADGTLYVPTESGVIARNPSDGSTVWSSASDATSVSSVSVRDGTVFVVGTAETTSVYAIDSSTGETVWRYEIPDVGGYDPALTLAVGAGTVAATTTEGTLVSLDAATGEKRWSEPGKTLPEYDVSFNAPPLIADDNLYVNLDMDVAGGIAVFDAQSGALRNWIPGVGGEYAMAHDGEMLFTQGEAIETHPDPPAAPTPSIEPEHTTPGSCVPLTFAVEFDEDLTDDERANLIYEWDYDGDGTIDFRESGGGFARAEHEYEIGEYTASLVVRNGYDQTAEATTTFRVVECEGELDPSIELLTEDPTAEEPITFEVTGEGKFDSYNWEFQGPTTIVDGDGDDRSETVVYDNSEYELVEVDVEDIYGRQAHAQMNVSVGPADSDDSTDGGNTDDGSDSTDDGSTDGGTDDDCV